MNPSELTSRNRLQLSVEITPQESEPPRETRTASTFDIEASEVLPDASRRPVEVRTWLVGTADEYNRAAKRFLLEIPIGPPERAANIERYVDSLMLQATPTQRELLRERRREVADALGGLYMQNRTGTFVLKASYHVTGAKGCQGVSRDVIVHIKDTGSFIDELNARTRK